MRNEVKNGIRSISADEGKRIVSKNEYGREFSGEIIQVEISESVYESRHFTASRYTELVLGKNDSADNYEEIGG